MIIGLVLMVMDVVVMMEEVSDGGIGANDSGGGGTSCSHGDSGGVGSGCKLDAPGNSVLSHLHQSSSILSLVFRFIEKIYTPTGISYFPQCVNHSGLI